METSTYTTTVLTASADHFLTQAVCEDARNAILTKKIWLAANDSADNWREITAEEAEAIKEQQEELRKQDEAAMEAEHQPNIEPSDETPEMAE